MLARQFTTTNVFLSMMMTKSSLATIDIFNSIVHWTNGYFSILQFTLRSDFFFVIFLALFSFRWWLSCIQFGRDRLESIQHIGQLCLRRPTLDQGKKGRKKKARNFTLHSIVITYDLNCPIWSTNNNTQHTNVRSLKTSRHTHTHIETIIIQLFHNCIYTPNGHTIVSAN